MIEERISRVFGITFQGGPQLGRDEQAILEGLMGLTPSAGPHHELGTAILNMSIATGKKGTNRAASKIRQMISIKPTVDWKKIGRYTVCIRNDWNCQGPFDGDFGPAGNVFANAVTALCDAINLNEEKPKEIVWVLGAPDLEMAEIAHLLNKANQMYRYAVNKDGKRVNPGEAYSPDSSFEQVGLNKNRHRLRFVECNIPAPGWSMVLPRIDHHKKGDRGYGKPPAEFWKASSIGQVWEILVSDKALPDNPPSAELLMVAANDHCPVGAYGGCCPKICPDKFRAFREKNLGLNPEFVKQLVNALEKATMIGPGVADQRPFFQGDFDERRHLLEASMITGIPYMVQFQEKGRTKITIGGAGTGSIIGEEPIHWFLGEFAEENGIIDTYGDPVRGFAGGYLPQQEGRQC